MAVKDPQDEYMEAPRDFKETFEELYISREPERDRLEYCPCGARVL